MIESIPSCLLQVYAVIGLGTKQQRFASVVSIVVSLLTISLGSTELSIGMDLSHEMRAVGPEFYGYVSNTSGKRALVFYLMLTFTFCHVLVRVVGIALLLVVSPILTAAVLGSDMLFYLAFKLVRDDLRYWLKIDGILSWVMSIMFRVSGKLMVDFTSIVQMRRKFMFASVDADLKLFRSQPN